jgi:hypothetical protein
MTDNFFGSLMNVDFSQWLGLITSPSFKTLQLAVVVYAGLLWLSIIVWVTRDAINRSNSLFFQVFAILINIAFPVLGTLLYLIIRPGKTTLERYYEELEHRLILESIESKAAPESQEGHPLKTLHRKAIRKMPKKSEELAEADDKAV